MRFVKCEVCNAEISGEKCVFAIHKRVIDDEEHYFCCEHHANEFERKYRESKNLKNTQQEPSTAS